MQYLALMMAGVLHAMSFALFDTQWSWVLSILCLAGLASVWFKPSSMKSIITATFCFGLGWFVGGLYWLHITMHNYGGMHWVLAAAAVVLFSFYLSSFFAFAAAGFYWLNRRPITLALVPLFAACVTGADIARGYFLTGFPWLAIGYAQVDSPLAYFAPVVGVYGVGFVATLIAGVIAFLLMSRGNPLAQSKLAIAALVLVAIATSVISRIKWAEPTTALSVALVQTNFAQEMKFNPQQIEGNMLRALALTDNTKADLVVLPETVWPVAFEVTKPGVREILRTLLAKPDQASQPNRARAIALGLPYIHSTGEPRLSNSVAVFDSAAQIDPQSPSFAPAYVYSKQHLVPFGEFIPWGFAWFVDMLGMPLGEFRRGSSQQGSFQIHNTSVAFNICYEDLFGEEIALQARQANILINVSNLGWFDKSLAIAQHLNIARMRALETQRPMLRSTNTGATVVIAPNGLITSAAPFWQEQAITVSVNGTQGLTPYVRWRNGPMMGLICLIVGVIALNIKNQQKNKQTHSRL